jgi:hypothetical protein
MYSMTYGTVRVAITNQCGTSGYSGITVYPRSDCPHYFTVYPNPASDEVTLTMSDELNNTTASQTNINFTVRIYNSQSALVSVVKRSGTSFTVPLTDIQDGTYIIEISDGKTGYRQPLIVRHN